MARTSSLVLILLDQAFNQGDLVLVDQLVSVTSSIHIPGWGVPANRLGLKQMIANLRTAFPDLHCTVEQEIEGESKSATLWTMRGTHRGLLFGNQPTGRPVEVQGVIFAYIGDGQIVENWLVIDQMTLLQQLGIVPPPRGKI